MSNADTVGPPKNNASRPALEFMFLGNIKIGLTGSFDIQLQFGGGKQEQKVIVWYSKTAPDARVVSF
jgi:hypothetical protein